MFTTPVKTYAMRIMSYLHNTKVINKLSDISLQIIGLSELVNFSTKTVNFSFHMVFTRVTADILDLNLEEKHKTLNTLNSMVKTFKKQVYQKKKKKK